jgi:hypothetical protein
MKILLALGILFLAGPSLPAQTLLASGIRDELPVGGRFLL